MDIKINPQEIPAIVEILKELVKQPMIVSAETEEEKIVQDTVTADEYLTEFIKKRLEEAQLNPSDGIIADIYPLVKKEFDELVNILRLKYTNMADYKAMQYATAARKANQYIASLTNTKENNEYLNDFVKALEAACLNMPDAQKDLLFKGLGETCKKDPIIFLGSYYNTLQKSATQPEKEVCAEDNTDNLPRESNGRDEIFRVFYRFIQDVDAPDKIEFDDPITYELDNYKNHYSPYRVNIDMSENSRILFAVERLAEKKGYYSNMKVVKELFCFRFQFVNGDLKRVYMTDRFTDINISNEKITTLISKLEKAIEDYKPEVIMHEVDEHNVHI